MKKKETMVCGLCNKGVEPLDTHVGRIDGILDVYHIDCWNNHLKPKMLSELTADEMGSIAKRLRAI